MSDHTCRSIGRWHRNGRTMTECEGRSRYTMQAKTVRADHAEQLKSGIVVVPDDLRELAS